MATAGGNARDAAIDVATGIAGAGLLPKQDIQADAFVDANPEYDGRGVTVAIFDTGIDPGALGLQTCPDGRPKVVDVLDCTGSGDVNTTTVVTPDKASGHLKGLSGRTLRLNSEWSNPSGKWRVGILQGYKVFSSALEKRLKSDRRKDWDKVQEQALQEAHKRLVAFDAANPDPGSSAALKAARQDLVDAVDAVKALQASYNDPGPVFDVVAWNDGTKWRASVDTSESGDLTAAVAFTNFADERQWGTFSNKDLCNFAVNIYDDGNVVSVVVAAGAHGSHVAGIVAAHDPEHPELNGVAPGAQIVCCKIGDSRLGSMETALGMERAVNAVIRNKCDLVNMSYGEPVVDPSHGRVVGAIRELVRRHGVIFVTSAGNAGPALTTVGAPASSCSSDVISVGAYVSPSMMKAQYSLEKPPPAVTYTWSSRGPTRLATTGVSICAPGGAIATVPTWTLKRNQHMNGTSMASPNACGGIALILSGLKARGIEYTPARVRRAVENTALHVAGVETLSQGCGLLQVDAAFQHVVEYASSKAFGLKINVRCNGLLGVYLREPHEVAGRDSFAAKVYASPGYHPDAPQESKVAFDSEVALVHTHSWLKVPAYFHFANARGFDLGVDLRGARAAEPSSMVHYGEIHGYDTTLPRAAGPLFRVPVTYLAPSVGPADELVERASSSVAPPSEPMRHLFTGLRFSPGQIHRRVIHVPANASRFTLRFRPGGSWGGGDNGANNRIMVVHCQQLVPQRAHRDSMLEKYFYFSRDTVVSEHTGRCYGGYTMEVVMAQFWNSSVGDSSLDAEVEFSGVSPHVTAFDGGITLEAKQGFARVDVTAPLGSGKQLLTPKAEVTHLERALHPLRYSIAPVEESTKETPLTRNAPTADGHPVYVLNLEYSFKVASAATYAVHAGALSEVLYENPFGSQMRVIYDANNRIVGTPDAWANANPTEKLEKGTYTVRVAIRHPNPSTLEGMKSLVLKLRSPLPKPVSLRCYASLPQLLGASGPVSKEPIVGGQTVPFFFQAPTMDAKALGEDAADGSALVGTCKWLASAEEHPDASTLRVIVCSVAKKPAAEAAAETQEAKAKARIAKAKEAVGPPKPKKHSIEALQSQIEDARVKHLEAIASELASQTVAATKPKAGAAAAAGGEGGGGKETDPAAEASTAAGLWQAEFDQLYATSGRTEELTLKLMGALLGKEEAVLLAVEKQVAGSTESASSAMHAAAVAVEASCLKAALAVGKEWKFQDVAVALARGKPDPADVEAAEAHRVASEKQKQLFKAACVHTRALHLKAATAADGKEAALVALNDNLKDLLTSPLANSDSTGDLKALNLLAHVANERYGSALKMSQEILAAIASGDKAKSKATGLDRALVHSLFVNALKKLPQLGHWVDYSAIWEILRKPTCVAKL